MPIRRFIRAASISCAVLLFGCTADWTTDMGISISGPPITDWPPERIVLEVGDQAWVLAPDLGGGTVLVSGSTALRVRVLWADDCRAIASFSAEAGARYIVRFSVDNEVTVEQVESVEMGPGLGEPTTSPCD